MTKVNATTIPELGLSATIRAVWPATKESASAQNPTSERERVGLTASSQRGF